MGLLATDESWLAPGTFMDVAGRFGVPVAILMCVVVFLGFLTFGVWLTWKWVMKKVDAALPTVTQRITVTWDKHNKFLDTANATMQSQAAANADHAAANKRHAETHAMNAESFKAISEVLEDGVENHRSKLSEVLRLFNGGLDAATEGLEEFERIHQNDPAMLKAIAKVRVRLASLRTPKSVA